MPSLLNCSTRLGLLVKTIPSTSASPASGRLFLRAASMRPSSPPAPRRFAAARASQTGHEVNKDSVVSEENVDPEVVSFRESQQNAPRITIAEEAKSLIMQGSHGVLSTIDAKGDTAGFPSGAMADYALDAKGLPIFALSRLSAHYGNLVADPRASLTVGARNWSGLSDARVTLTGTVSIVAQGPERDELRAAFLAKHPQSFWVDFGDFSFFHMKDVKLARLVSGFGRAGSVLGAEYVEAAEDPVSKFSEPVCSHMNDDHTDAVLAIVRGYTKMASIERASMLSLDRLGMVVQCSKGEQTFKARVPWTREAKDRKAVKEIIVEMTRAAAGAQ